MKHSRHLYWGAALLIIAGACSLSLDVDDYQYAPGAAAAGGTSSAGGNGGTGASGGSNGGGAGAPFALPPGLMIDSVPLLFRAGDVSHPDGLLAGQLTTDTSPLGTTILPNCQTNAACYASQTGNEVCVSGTTTAVPNGDFDNYYGGSLEILFAFDWDRAKGRARGIAFRVTGGALEELSFGVGIAGTPNVYGANLRSGSGAEYKLLFDTLIYPVWEPQNAVSLPSTSPIRNFSWNVGAVEERGKSFDFCVSDIRLILAE